MTRPHITYHHVGERVSTLLVERADGSLCESITVETVPALPLELLPDRPRTASYHEHLARREAHPYHHAWSMSL